jgi:acyl-CoA hydrolase/GNAT superfamily N-acetyltransferase
VNTDENTPKKNILNPNLPERLKKEFLQKLKTPREAVDLIHSGDRVYLSSNCGQPQTMTEALTLRKDDLFGVEVVHILMHGIAPHVELEYGENFRDVSLFMGGNVRKAVNEGRAEYAPIFLSEICDLFRHGQMPIDVAIVAVTPPDEHGYCSMGIAVDVGLAACQVAPIIIAEVMPTMPRTLGTGFLHIEDIDCFVESTYGPVSHAQGTPDEISDRIASYIADMIPDGATLQAGIGSIPDAVMTKMVTKNDLGMHTETFGDGVIPLIENGNLTGRKKTLHPGKVVSTFVIGTTKLFGYIDNNPLFEFRTSDYVNDPFVIAQNNDMIAVNSAIEVDLTGQIVSDSIGTRFYSGIGGQVDFIRGAARSKGGKPIIALPATAKGGTISKIVKFIQPGAGVVTSRGDAHYVVTEYGVAYLHGKTISERALSLIRIAHPKFRDQLLEEAKEAGYVRKDQPSIEHRYPSELIRTMTCKTGEEITLRPILPTDEQNLKNHFYSLSPESVHRRFNAALKSLSNAKFRELVNVDYKSHMAFVAVLKDGAGEKIITSGRYYVNQTTNFAELSIATRDEWQGRGIGRAVFDALIEAAQEAKLQGMDAYVQVDNPEMMKLIQSCALPTETKLVDGQYHVRITFRKKRDVGPDND